MTAAEYWVYKPVVYNGGATIWERSCGAVSGLWVLRVAESESDVDNHSARTLLWHVPAVAVVLYATAYGTANGTADGGTDGRKMSSFWEKMR